MNLYERLEKNLDAIYETTHNYFYITLYDRSPYRPLHGYHTIAYTEKDVAEAVKPMLPKLLDDDPSQPIRRWIRIVCPERGHDMTYLDVYIDAVAQEDDGSDAFSDTENDPKPRLSFTEHKGKDARPYDMSMLKSWLREIEF